MSNNDKTDHYRDAILREMNDRFQSIMEGQAAMASVPDDIAQIKEDVRQLKSDMAAVKAVATDHSAILLNHDKRITKLERRECSRLR